MTNHDTARAGITTGTAHHTTVQKHPSPATTATALSPLKPVDPRTAGRLRRRPTGPMGLPIPAMNGRPGPLGIDTTDFLSVDPARVLLLARRALCAICAEPIRDGYAFLSGPKTHKARRSTNPAAHETCLLAAMGLCPYISRPAKLRATGRRAAHLPNGDVVLAKPDVWVLGVTDSYHIEVFEGTNDVHVVAAEWTRARYFRYSDGRLQETGR